MDSAIHSVDTYPLKGRKVLLRLDLNVPISGKGENRKIDDDTRIREALPTIKYCLEKGAKLILCSHLGRPDGKRNPEFSLEPVAKHLAAALDTEVLLSDDCVGDGVHQIIHHSKERVILLENLRFYPEEEANDPEFSRELARLADLYITDAFGTAHRKHASTYGVPSIMSEAGAGFLIKKELDYLSRLIENPPHPFVLVTGGSKVTDKLKAIDNLLNFVDKIVVGGAMAYAFLAAEGKNIGVSKCEKEGVAAAAQILAKAKSRKVEILLPVDHQIVFPEKDANFTSPSRIDDIPAGAMALDIGDRTIKKFSDAIGSARTIFWNGPMGFFEKEQFLAGTKAIAHAIAKNDGIKVAGGGDTLSAIAVCGEEAGFNLLSTGGGASLKFLEGRGLPGIEVLKGKGAPVKTMYNIEGDFS